MTDHPVLIPTSIGPFGGMVTDPGNAKAAAILMAGQGGRRFGVNQLWTSMAWDLAERGLVVLRLDFPGGQGDSSLAHREGTPKPLREILAWYRARIDGRGIVLLGSCYGARISALVGSVEDDILGVGLITPTFVRWNRKDAEADSLGSKVRRRARKQIGKFTPQALDPLVVQAVIKAHQRTQVWAMVGEKDHRSMTDLARVQDMFRKEGVDPFEVEEIPGLILHTQPSRQGQQTTKDRVGAWISRLLDQEVVRT
jgi:dienelactone hydrolase